MSLSMATIDCKRGRKIFGRWCKSTKILFTLVLGVLGLYFTRLKPPLPSPPKKKKWAQVKLPLTHQQPSQSYPSNQWRKIASVSTEVTEIALGRWRKTKKKRYNQQYCYNVIDDLLKVAAIHNIHSHQIHLINTIRPSTAIASYDDAIYNHPHLCASVDTLLFTSFN